MLADYDCLFLYNEKNDGKQLDWERQEIMMKKVDDLPFAGMAIETNRRNENMSRHRLISSSRVENLSLYVRFTFLPGTVFTYRRNKSLFGYSFDIK